MNEEKSHIEQGQIERARRLRRYVKDLGAGGGSQDEPSTENKSLKEQIEARARVAVQRQKAAEAE